MTREQEALLLELINNPPPGSEMAKAKEFGVDLSLFHSTLRRTATERAQSLSNASEFLKNWKHSDNDRLQ